MKLTLLSLLVAAGVLITLVAFVSKKGDFETAKEVVVMRQIAHEVMKYTGDSTSGVLPVNQLTEQSFQIPFSSSFSFLPDSLVAIIDKVLLNNKLPSKYIVNVMDAATEQPVFAYAVMGTESKNVVPCIGRDQPMKHYYINIQFPDEPFDVTKKLYVAGIGLLGIGLLLFGRHYYKRKKPVEEIAPVNTLVAASPATTKTIAIGNYQFDVEQQQLILDKERIELTSKEAKLLSIFALQPNLVIDRNRLQKEVWEDEGVIVGRSLDMFISKLRKKLDKDPAVKLVNIHGKGYKLEIGQDTTSAV